MATYKRNRSNTDAQHDFARIPSVQGQRSVFNRSSGCKTTFDSGLLIPIWADEALPGDTINLKATIVARLASLLHPIMDNIWLDVHYFAVPIRLLWDNWEKMNGAQDDPDDSTDFTVPTMTSDATTGHLEQSVADYLGIPTKIKDLEHSALWHRAYNLIFNEWYRHEALTDSAFIDRSDTPADPANYPLRERGKRHDYFTSGLPWPQKGDQVTLSLGDTAPVQITTGEIAVLHDFDNTPTFEVAGTSGVSLKSEATGTDAIWSTSSSTAENAIWDDPSLKVDMSTNVGVADLTAATAITINQLRQAFQFQRILEKDARGGTRYTEVLRTHFGVTSPDSRLQRPEFLGGGTIPIILRQVEQTSNAGTGEVGDLAGYGVATGQDRGFTKSFTEHCILIGMISARADLNYQQGLDRQFSRATRFDFFWPALANLGEQAVLNKEIYAQGSDDPTADADVFAYQERWAEYRYKPSIVTGLMRSNATQSLDTWHLAQDFDPLPTLSDAFIKENPPIERVVAVLSQPEFILDAHITSRHARPIPTNSVPGMIDHF